MKRPGLLFLLLLVGMVAAWGSGAYSEDETHRRVATNESDSLALLAFFFGTEWQQWTRRDNWVIGHVDTWYGVTVEDGRVTRVDLPENNIRFEENRGVLPPELGNLSFLRVLDLRGNGLRGEVPKEIVNLTRLEELYLQDNFFDILPDLSPLRDHALMILNLANNRFTFEDLEPVANQGFLIDYTPQQSFGLPLLPRAGYEGERVIIKAEVGGTDNQYQWYLREFLLEGATQSQLAIEPVSDANIGPYTLEVTSPLVPDLVLKSTDQNTELHQTV